MRPRAGSVGRTRHSFEFPKGSRKKKVLFLVARPLRPLPPTPPLGLVGIGTFFFVLKLPETDFDKKKFSTIFGVKYIYFKKSYFFLSGWALTPPPSPFSGRAIFCGFPKFLGVDLSAHLLWKKCIPRERKFFSNIIFRLWFLRMCGKRSLQLMNQDSQPNI